MEISEFQNTIREIYFKKDSDRGLPGTFAWFVEEVGELSRALRRGTHAQMEEEFSDVFAWLASLASIAGVDLADAVERYREGCPKCNSSPCRCSEPHSGDY